MTETAPLPALSSVMAPRLRRTRALSLYYVVILCAALSACSSWQAPAPFDATTLAARAVTATVQEVQLSAAILSSADSRRFFGADVNAAGIQPVWVEVRNPGPHALWLLRAGTDPDYFSPLEVAWSFHTPLGGANNTAIDEHFNGFALQNPIAPRSTHSGIIFTNPHRNVKVFNVDLLGQRKLLPFTLFLPVPDDHSDHTIEQNMARYGSARRDFDDPDALRAALEQLPCCARDADGEATGDPLNAVLIGTFADIGSAVVRRGFRSERMDFDDAQFLYGRPPDIILRKTSQDNGPAHWVRFWILPLSYRGQPVFLAQVGRPVGGRFAINNNNNNDNRVLHPNVDEARNLLIQDLLYSGGLARLGFVDGVGKVETTRPRQSQEGAHYYTDGLRAVMFFVTRPLDLSDVELLDWVPLPGRHVDDTTTELTNARRP